MKKIIFLATAIISIITIITGCKKDDKATKAVISTAAASSITANSATVGGTITSNGGSTISQSGIVWALHNNPTISDSLVPGNTGTGSFTIPLSNLNANTWYYDRAFAINGIGTAYGNTDSFQTSKGVPSLTTTAITNNQMLMAQTGWTLLNNGGAAITAVGVCWSTSPHPTTSNSKTADSISLHSFVDTLKNLEVTTYYLRAYATNSFGTGYGNEITLIVNSTGTVTDVDGNSYLTVTIGTQTWMASNLKTTHYQNGDPIVDGSAPGYDWDNPSIYLIGAYTYPNDSSSYNAVYGKYYNYPALSDARNICPAGWKVPGLGDWQTLEFFEGEAASDTGVYVAQPAGNIGGKLLVGGSSGLNLQLGGILLFGTPGQPGTYYPPGDGQYGQYATNTTAFGAPLGSPDYTGHFFIFFNLSGPGPIYTDYGTGEIGSVRCIKQ